MLPSISRRTGAPRPLTQLLVLGVLLLQFAGVANAISAASLFKRCMCIACCFSNDDNDGPIPLTAAQSSRTDTGGVDCVNPNAPKNADDWGIHKLHSFPTVEQLMADIELCGIATKADNTALFYSFGGGAPKAKEFKAKEKAKGINLITIHDIMPQHFIVAAEKFGTVNAGGTPDQVLWVARMSQAFARVVHGDVYCVTSGKEEVIGGKEVGKATIYTIPTVNQQMPWWGTHNVWYDYEFWYLQQNSKVNRIITVQNDKLEPLLTEEGTWVREPRQGLEAQFHVNANDVKTAKFKQLKEQFMELPDATKKRIMDGDECPPGNGVLTKRSHAAGGGSCPLSPFTENDKPSKSSSAKPEKTTAASKKGSKSSHKGNQEAGKKGGQSSQEGHNSKSKSSSGSSKKGGSTSHKSSGGATKSKGKGKRSLRK